MSSVVSLIVPLLVQLGSDAALAEAYNQNPEAVMTQFNLTESDKVAMRSHSVDILKNITEHADIRMHDTVVSAYK